MRESLRSFTSHHQLLDSLLLGFSHDFTAGITMIPFLIAGYSMRALVQDQSLSRNQIGSIFFLKVMQMAQALVFSFAHILSYVFLQEDRYKAIRASLCRIFSAADFRSLPCSRPFLSLIFGEWNCRLVFPIDSITLDADKRENAEHLIKLFLATDPLVVEF